MPSRSIRVRTSTETLHSLEIGDREYVLGSERSDGILLMDAEGVSPRHAKVRFLEDGLELEDLGSSSGTLVNGKRVQGRIRVSYPVSVHFGEADFRVERVGEKALSISTRTLRLVHTKPGEGRFLSKPEAADATERILHASVPGGSAGEEGLDLSGAVAEGVTVCVEMQPEDAGMDRDVEVRMAYKLREVIGRGGMGRIYAAEDETLKREVALKVSRMSGTDEDAAFLREAEVLARLAHPNIVPIHNLGRDSQGRPFYSMKWVKGRTLQAVLKRLRHGELEALESYTLQHLLIIFQKVCDAVAFAHAHGYLHRDLKPENVMIGEYGEVMLMDWGLARRIEKEAVQDSLETASELGGRVVVRRYIEGTPQYMSPEQAEGNALDERSDIYALGGLLYAILTLRAPVQGGSISEVLNKVKRGEIDAIVAPHQGVRVPGLSAKHSEVPSALRAVVAKAMSLQRTARYARVEDLRRDVDAFQGGFATDAEGAGLVRLLVLFIHRHRLVAAVVLMSIVGAVSTLIRLAQSERRARSNALRAEEQAGLALENARRAEEMARVASANEVKALEEKESARHFSAQVQIGQAEAAEQDQNGEEMQRALSGVPESERNQTWRYLQNSLDTSSLTLEAKDNSSWTCFAPHPLKPGVLYTLQFNGWIRTLDLETGACEDSLKLEAAALYTKTFAVSADALRVAVLRNLPKGFEQDGPIAQMEVYQLAGGQKVLEQKVPVSAGLMELRFNPDGTRLLLTAKTGAGSGPTLQMFEADTGTLVWERRGDGDCFSEFSKDGSAVHVFCSKSGLMRLDARTGASVQPDVNIPFPSASQAGYRFTPISDWTRLAYLNGKVCRELDSRDGKMGFELRLPNGANPGTQIEALQKEGFLVTLSPTADKSAVLQFWGSAAGAAMQSVFVVMERRFGRDWMLTTHPASNHVAVSRGRSMKVWRVGRIRGEKIVYADQTPDGFTFLDQPWRVLRERTRDGKQRAEVLDLRKPEFEKDAQMTLVQSGSLAGSLGVSTSGDGRFLGASWSGDSPTAVQVYRVADERLEEVSRVPLSAGSTRFQLSPTGKLIWTETHIHETKAGASIVKLNRKELESLPEPEEPAARWVGEERIAEIARAPSVDSDAGTKSRQRFILLWDARNGQRSVVAEAPFANALSVAPDGSQIAEAGKDMRVRIRNGITLAVETVLRVHDAPVVDVAWHPVLPLLATVSSDRRVRIWDLRSKLLVQEYGLFSPLPRSVYWSPDGSVLAVKLVDESSKGQAHVHFFRPKVCQTDTQ